MHTGEKLKIALAMKQIKSKEMAEKLGTSPQQVSNWVSSGKITILTVSDMCEVLGMTLGEFFAIGEG
tara:strand:- start:344 stop:544 length:201 start_codon:yes stop_codon:yes gene_type:complete